MPLLVGRRVLVVLPAVAFALAPAGVAAAGNGGFGRPEAHSPNTHHTNTAYWVIFIFTSAIFVLVEGALVLFIVKYRRRGRPRTAEGAQVHGNTFLEVLWPVLPVLIILPIGTVVFIELPKMPPPAAASEY